MRIMFHISEILNNIKINRRIKFVCFIIVVAAVYLINTAFSAKNDSLLNIHFGKDGIINYDLKEGHYSIVFNKNIAIKNASVETEGLLQFDIKNAVFNHYTKTSVNSVLGAGKKYSLIWNTSKGNKIEQIFFVYPIKNYFITQVIVSGKNAASNYISPLKNADLKFNMAGDNRALFVPFDNDMWVRYNAEKLDSARFTSSEATTIYNDESYKGIVIGSLEHDIWKSAVNVISSNDNSSKLTVYAGFSDSITTHDKLRHGLVINKDSVSASPQFMIGYFDDWREGMETYGKNNSLMEPQTIFNWTSPTPVGWNSWGVLQDKLTLTKAKSVIDFFADSCKNFRTSDHTLFIDLDAFWDNMNHGNIDENVDSLKEFVAYCNEHGFKPGIYWTPFTDWGKSDRKVEGTNYRYPHCWTKVKDKPIDIDGGRAIDPTHPATKQRMIYYVNAFKKLGFKMIKIDFLAHGTLEADSYYDKNVHTGMQAFAEGMKYLDHQIGNSMLVYAAISPNLATARYVHVRRIACDAFKRIDETAYTLNSTTYGWWLSQMYNYMDADHVVFDDVSDGENHARLAAAVVTGSLITGDDYSSKGKWKTTATQLLQNKELLSIVQYDGKSFRPIEGNTDKNASRLFIKTIGKHIYLAAFNYGNNPMRIDLSKYQILKNLEGNAYDVFKQTQLNKNASRILEIPAKDVMFYLLNKE